MTRPLIGARTLISVSSHSFLLCLAALAACTACHGYLKNAPPRDRLSGIWIIDPNRTSWREAKSLLASGEISPQRGYLELKLDGQFVIADLPDFSKSCPTSIMPHQNASGTWWRAYDQMNEISYLWLEFEKVNGKPAEGKCASFHFQQEGVDYFLHVMILDPESGDVLVLRKKEGEGEKGINESAGQNR